MWASVGVWVSWVRGAGVWGVAMGAGVWLSVSAWCAGSLAMCVGLGAAFFHNVFPVDESFFFLKKNKVSLPKLRAELSFQKQKLKTKL